MLGKRIYSKKGDGNVTRKKIFQKGGRNCWEKEYISKRGTDMMQRRRYSKKGDGNDTKKKIFRKGGQK